MRLLLISVAQRLAGMGGDPVIQLQTSFGGKITRCWRCFTGLENVSTDKLDGIPPLLDQADISELPAAKIAALDGIAMSVSQGKKHDDITANTLWGEMAFQLLGAEGYEIVARSDLDGTAPGKDVLIELLSTAAPCVVLIDELQKFFSDLTPGKKLNAGTYEANLKFIQALTEALNLCQMPFCWPPCRSLRPRSAIRLGRVPLKRLSITSAVSSRLEAGWHRRSF